MCGDGAVGAGEACDDGNTVASDGCSPTCAFEATCGNNKVEPGEACDDNNTTAGDGCSSTCQLEAGTTCGDAINLNDPTKVTVSGAVTTYLGTTAASADTTFGASPSCTEGTGGVPRVAHRYRVGGHPAALHVATADVGGTLADTVVWAFLNCQTAKPELACGDDTGGRLGAIDTGYLPAGTTVFVVVSGYSAVDVGAYELSIAEMPATAVASSGTCASPTTAGPGTWAGVTLATGPHSGIAGSACVSSSPDAVYAVNVSAPSDLIASVASNTGSLDLTLSLLDAGCAAGTEIRCADTYGAGSAESLTAKDLAPGPYYVVVGGAGAADLGAYVLSLNMVSVLATGAACDPTSTTQRCETGDVCRAGTCQTPTELLFADFSVDLSPFAVTDSLGDGNTWMYCDPAGLCDWDNTTGLNPTDPFALVHDMPSVSMQGEILASPALDASSLSSVWLALDQSFEHVTGCADLGVIEVSTNGSTWASAASYATDQHGHTTVDLSAQAAGHSSFFVRFRYEDQTIPTADPFAMGWRIDDVRVYGF